MKNTLLTKVLVIEILNYIDIQTLVIFGLVCKECQTLSKDEKILKSKSVYLLKSIQCLLDINSLDKDINLLSFVKNCFSVVNKTKKIREYKEKVNQVRIELIPKTRMIRDSNNSINFFHSHPSNLYLTENFHSYNIITIKPSLWKRFIIDRKIKKYLNEEKLLIKDIEALKNNISTKFFKH